MGLVASLAERDQSDYYTIQSLVAEFKSKPASIKSFFDIYNNKFSALHYYGSSWRIKEKIMKLLEIFGLSADLPVTLSCDNKVTTSLSFNFVEEQKVALKQFANDKRINITVQKLVIKFDFSMDSESAKAVISYNDSKTGDTLLLEKNVLVSKNGSAASSADLMKPFTSPSFNIQENLITFYKFVTPNREDDDLEYGALEMVTCQVSQSKNYIVSQQSCIPNSIVFSNFQQNCTVPVGKEHVTLSSISLETSSGKSEILLKASMPNVTATFDLKGKYLKIARNNLQVFKIENSEILNWIPNLQIKQLPQFVRTIQHMWTISFKIAKGSTIANMKFESAAISSISYAVRDFFEKTIQNAFRFTVDCKTGTISDIIVTDKVFYSNFTLGTIPVIKFNESTRLELQNCDLSGISYSSKADAAFFDKIKNVNLKVFLQYLNLTPVNVFLEHDFKLDNLNATLNIITEKITFSINSKHKLIIDCPSYSGFLMIFEKDGMTQVPVMHKQLFKMSSALWAIRNQQKLTSVEFIFSSKE